MTNPVPQDPGDHPGVTILELTDEPTVSGPAIEAILETNRNFLFTYNVGKKAFAVFASSY